MTTTAILCRRRGCQEYYGSWLPFLLDARAADPKPWHVGFHRGQVSPTRRNDRHAAGKVFRVNLNVFAIRRMLKRLHDQTDLPRGRARTVGMVIPIPNGSPTFDSE